MGKQSGVSLIELLVTLAVLGILIGLAVPSFTQLIARNRLTAAANEFVSTVQTARMEAVRRNGRVGICPTTNGTSCSGSDWTRTIVFFDADRDNAVGANDTVIRDVVAAQGNGIVVKGSAPLATNNRMWFSADGFVRMGNPVVRSGDITLCSNKVTSGPNLRTVKVNVSRINVEPSTVTACN
ncbi:GspH/FimT family pseudopilin [Lysobacter soli]|uniref:GspH/FimT family pseudopilin n=1 Tax=Lysobacter soli TaxID=453783 RepID=UPI0037C8D074